MILSHLNRLTKELAAAKKKEVVLVFEIGQYTIDEKIKVRICKSQLVNNRDFFLQLLSELIRGSTNPEDLVEYYKQRAILFYKRKNYKG